MGVEPGLAFGEAGFDPVEVRFREGRFDLFFARGGEGRVLARAVTWHIQRRVMVADVSRRTGESHREVHARINRMTGVQSVSKATRQQLERGNALLRDDLR